MNSKQWLSVWGLNRPAMSLKTAADRFVALPKATVALALHGGQRMPPRTLVVRGLT